MRLQIQMSFQKICENVISTVRLGIFLDIKQHRLFESLFICILSTKRLHMFTYTESGILPNVLTTANENALK